MFTARPITYRAACAWVEAVHRTHQAPRGQKFAVAAFVGDRMVGVAIAGRPVAKAQDDGLTLEVTRVATDGTRNACTFLYARVLRAGRAMGYRRFITYTHPEEGGASLRAGGWRLAGTTGEPRGWSRPNRQRVDTHPTGSERIRWEHS